jgi:hypothetical protein
MAVKTATPVEIKVGHLGHLAGQILTTKGASTEGIKAGTLGTLTSRYAGEKD